MSMKFLAILFCLFIFMCKEISSAPGISKVDVKFETANFIRPRTPSQCPPGQVRIQNTCRLRNQMA